MSKSRRHQTRRIDMHLGPKRIQGSKPAGKIHLEIEIGDDDITFDVHLDARNVDRGRQLPIEFSEPLYSEIEYLVNKIRKMFDLTNAIVRFPPDSENGTWPNIQDLKNKLEGTGCSVVAKDFI